MKIISLSYEEAGYACSIASSIKKKYNCITQFFDYLVVDMKTINEILLLKNINLIINNFQISNIENHNYMSVKWNNFSKLISYHDLGLNYNELGLENLKKKYTRRFFRLVNDIYSEDIIFFIRYGKTPLNDIIQFNENIRKLNEKLIFYFINVDYDEDLKNNIIHEGINNYIYINFFHINENKTHNEDLYFRILEYNWDFVFNLIETNNKYYSK